MSITVTRTKTDMIGTPGSPSSIAASATNTSTALSLTAVAGTLAASVGLTLISGGTAPTTPVAIRFSYSEDGTNYVQDGPDILLSMSSTTTYTYRYDPPDACQLTRVVVVNGASNAITAWCQGSVLSVS